MSGAFLSLKWGFLALAEFSLVPSASISCCTCALWCVFEFLLGPSCGERRSREAPRWGAGKGARSCPDSGWIAFAYLAFLFGVYSQTQLMMVTPDLCVACSVFPGRWPGGPHPKRDIRWKTFALAGWCSGHRLSGQITHVDLGIIFLGMTLTANQPFKKWLLRVSCGFAVFLLAASLFIGSFVPSFRAG